MALGLYTVLSCCLSAPDLPVLCSVMLGWMVKTTFLLAHLFCVRFHQEGTQEEGCRAREKEGIHPFLSVSSSSEHHPSTTTAWQHRHFLLGAVAEPRGPFFPTLAEPALSYPGLRDTSRSTSLELNPSDLCSKLRDLSFTRAPFKLLCFRNSKSFPSPSPREGSYSLQLLPLGYLTILSAISVNRLVTSLLKSLVWFLSPARTLDSEANLRVLLEKH